MEIVIFIFVVSLVCFVILPVCWLLGKIVKVIKKRVLEPKRMAKLFSSDSNPNYNYLKVAGYLNADNNGKNIRLLELRKEISKILRYPYDNILLRYNKWKVDFHSCRRVTNNRPGSHFFGISADSHEVIYEENFNPISSSTSETGNIFPGITFESPFFFTPEMSSCRLVFNAMGILILSDKYDPNQHLVLRVLGIKSSSDMNESKVFFKIIRPFYPSDFKEGRERLFIPKNNPKKSKVLAKSVI